MFGKRGAGLRPATLSFPASALILANNKPPFKGGATESTFRTGQAVFVRAGTSEMSKKDNGGFDRRDVLKHIAIVAGSAPLPSGASAGTAAARTALAMESGPALGA